MPYSSVIVVTGNEALKLCKACDDFFPVSYFHLDNGAPDGLRHSCKTCCNESSRKHKARNVEKYRQYARDYRAADPERQKEQVNRYQKKPNGHFSKLKCEAKSRGIEVALTREEYAKFLFYKQCVYCGSQVSVLGHGVDRKDSSKGYSLDNCVPCCGPCNKIKSDELTYEEMLAVAKLLKEMRSKCLSTEN